MSSEVPSLLYPNPHLKICLLNPPQPPERDHNHLGGVAEAFPSLSVRQNDLGGSSPFSHRASLTDLTRLFSEGQKALPQHLRLLQPAWHEAVRALDAFLWESTAQSCFGRKAPTLLQDLGGWRGTRCSHFLFFFGKRPCSPAEAVPGRNMKETPALTRPLLIPATGSTALRKGHTFTTAPCAPGAHPGLKRYRGSSRLDQIADTDKSCPLKTSTIASPRRHAAGRPQRHPRGTGGHALPGPRSGRFTHQPSTRRPRLENTRCVLT